MKFRILFQKILTQKNNNNSVLFMKNTEFFFDKCEQISSWDSNRPDDKRRRRVRDVGARTLRDDIRHLLRKF